jgi:outer membrane protein assembly factor BamB
MKIYKHLTNWSYLFIFLFLSVNAYTADIGTVQKYLWGWGHKTDAEIFSLPSVGEYIYFGNTKGNLFCLSKENGDVKWKISGFERIFSNPLLVEDSIYVAASTDYLYCFSASSGKKIWESKIRNCWRNNPQIYENNILITGTNQIVAVSKHSGEISFSIKIKGEGGAFTIKDDLCYVISNSALEDKYEDINAWRGTLTCIELKKKVALWSKPLERGCFGEVRTDNKRCYLGCMNGFFYALNNKDGTVLWEIDCKKLLLKDPRIDTIWKWDLDKDSKLDDKTKKERLNWYKPVRGDSYVFVDEQHMFFAPSHRLISSPGAIVCIKKEDGKIVWQVNHRTKFCGKFSIMDDKIVAVTEDRVVYIIDKKTGNSETFSILPEADRGEFVGVTRDDDSIYIGGADKTLYKIVYAKLEKLI